MNGIQCKTKNILIATAVIFAIFIVLKGCDKNIRLHFFRSLGVTRHGPNANEFFDTVKNKNIDGVDRVREFLEAGISPNMVDDNGYTALMYAIAAGKTNMVSFLIDRGAYVETVTPEGVTPLLDACASDDNVWAVRLLVNNGANINYATASGTTALMMAAKRGFASTTEVLMDLGADISMTNMLGETAAELAWSRGHREIAKKILERCSHEP